jgi:hypothetical protein
MNQIVDDILNSISQHTEKEAHGMIFVKDVSDACEKLNKEEKLF